MKYDFAALRFTEDKNLAERVYWYLSELPLALGERVLAPVGPHDRLQAARVEKLLSAEEKDAPYDMRLIKRVEAKLGFRKLTLGGESFLELGGVRYDDRHYTAFGKVVLAKAAPSAREQLRGYGVTKTLEGMEEGPALYEEIAHASGCVLLAGEAGKRVFSALLSLMKGECKEITGVSAETLALIEEKLR